ncbi:Thioesterase/thiol ester dehydrase-isomerase [Suhomyces tanzawaensis NRRL Y-17324]|uniref:Thioesterase/thiol ester dehydrase-isomerase n=1 Tax=Suhomyces tanzawaensis NRRL Y-17324 TaxID=984487 RepID=A0A1E4SAT9_9ASCO|nr:Thioesterase/thiol ester dehydrase-isomerase [Suhomyces tanzawaensis NRRL Y-17324]ODV76624.1 Thioesterase/thiol ester dehydrase-isomerase [Suhomyces tanzawaensis NRRL Y-17324]
MKALAESSGSKIEEKFALSVTDSTPSSTTLEGKHPLQPFRKGARGTFGGELVAQALNAACATVEVPEFTPHSLHLYFVKAGLDDTTMVWQVQHVSDTKNYANRLVQGFQGTGGRLVYVCQVSFTRANHSEHRIKAAEEKAAAVVQAGGIARELPVQFQTKPNFLFEKYRNRLDEFNSHIHTFDMLEHITPPDYSYRDQKTDLGAAGNKQFGFFFRVRDDWRKAQNPTTTRFLQLAFASDSAYLGTVVGALGLRLPVDMKDPAMLPTFAFFRVSLDHTIYFHDLDFDPASWMFLDYKFSRLNNDRVLCQCIVYTLEGKMVALVIQEGLVYFTDEILGRVKRLGVDGDDLGVSKL